MVIYPLILLLLGLFRKVKVSNSLVEFPFVSIMVAARNEELCIGARIENLLAQDYPKGSFEILVASDVSTDKTDEIVKSFSDSRIHFLRSEKRMGKSALMFELSKIAKGEILIFTDANTQFRFDTVRELIKPFVNKSVGCVDGSKRNSLDSVTCESIYWRYEQWVKALGSKIGAVLGATGAVFAVRKSLYNPSDPSRADDFETAVGTRLKGYYCVFNRNAVAAEPTPDNSSQFNRLVRIVSWMAGSSVSLFKQALKNKLYALALQLFVHKMLRWNMGLFAVISSIAGIFLCVFDTPYSIIPFSVIVFNFLAVLGRFGGSKLPSLLRLPYFFWLMSLASLLGVVKAINSKAVSIWDHASR